VQPVPRALELAETGLEAARFRMLAAHSEDDALCALAEILCWIYGLEEWWRRTLGASIYYTERDNRTDGQLVGGLVWARRFAQHELARTADIGDRYSDFLTETFGVLVWRSRSQLPTRKRNRSQTHRRDAFYDQHLADQVVPETIATAQQFFAYLRPLATSSP
jgi:hypothetical protein